MARGETTVLRVEITGDAAGVTRAFRQMSSEAQKAGTITTQQARSMTKALDDVDRKAKGLNLAKLSDAGRGAAAGRLGQLAGGGLGGDLVAGLGGAEQLLEKISTKTLVAAAAVTALGAAAVKAGQLSLNNFEQVGTAVGKFQQTLGVSAEEATKFWFAMSASGVNPEQGLDALNQFAVNITQNRDDLDKFGVSVARFSDGTTDMAGTLANVIDRYHELGDSAERARLLSVTLGEEGMRQLQPLIRRGAESFRELSGEAKNLVTEDMLKKLDDYKAAWGAATAQFKLATAALGAELAPALTKVGEGLGVSIPLALNLGKAMFGPINAIETFIPGARAGAVAARELGGAFAWVADQAGKIAHPMGTVGEALGGVGHRAPAIHATAEQLESMGKQAQAAAQTADKLRSSYRQASSSVVTSSAALADARRNAADAEVSAAQTISDANKQAAQSIVSAEQQVSSARESRSSAVESLAQAEVQAARSIADAEKAAAKSIIEAQKRLGDAHKDRVEAVEDLARAEVDAAERVAEANEDASKRVADAHRRVAEARERASRTQRDNARKLQDAEEAVRDALTAALTDDNPITAARRREEAQQSYQRVREDVAEAELDAARNVQDAEAGLRDATVEAEKRRSDAAEQAAEVVTAARARVVESDSRVHEAEVNLAETAAEAEQRKVDAANSAAQSVSSARAAVASADAAVAQAEVNLANTVIEAEEAKARAAIQAANMINAAHKSVAVYEAALFSFELQLHKSRLLMAAQISDAKLLPYLNVASGPGGVTRPWETRAAGGPVRAGRTYLIGEKGPEWLQMGSTSGHVDANGSWGGGGVTININAPVYGDRRALVEEIRRAVRDGFNP